MTSDRLRHAVIVGIFLIAGCTPFSGMVHDETLVGPYRLAAADVDEDMSICWSGPGGVCVGDGLPGPTVFAAGYNEKYLVAAVHPRKFPDEPDRVITQYFYVVRSSDEARKLPYGGIKGPFDEAAYNAEKARLRLPEFTRTFENLR
ncbi:hypothetical protein [Sphingopyxis sp.]|uniref:hypothetical protein n=1 Tax=Sphingopyxis sp. TaxID=1908224 RepID=UPI0026239C20|nr:hypothetical protein [Sphingopyxis sp.]MCW0196734.1 hypothetical protein [Sphingopyxis sp.]